MARYVTNCTNRLIDRQYGKMAVLGKIDFHELMSELQPSYT